MGKRDEQYKLGGLVEVDDAFFEHVPTFKKKDDESEKRGRGSGKQIKVLVMASSESVKEADRPDKHSKSTKLKFVKMLVMDDLAALTIAAAVESGVDPKSTVKTDASKGNNLIKDKVCRHIGQVVPRNRSRESTTLVHTNYLNEYCYKLNRRYMKANLFNRVIVASVASSWYAD